MFNIMNLNNVQNIFYWTDNNGAISFPGDTALTYRTESDLPRFVTAVYSALNTDSGVSERVVTLNGHCGLLLDVLYDILKDGKAKIVKHHPFTIQLL